MQAEPSSAALLKFHQRIEIRVEFSPGMFGYRVFLPLHTHGGRGLSSPAPCQGLLPTRMGLSMQSMPGVAGVGVLGRRVTLAGALCVLTCAVSWWQ